MEITGSPIKVLLPAERKTVTESPSLREASAPVDGVTLSDAQAPLPEKEWTILHYGCADNNLGQYWVDNLNEMQVVGSGDNLNIISQLDLKKGCTRYYITKGSGEAFTSPALENLGEVNMADPAVLSDFIRYGMKNFPAKHYMLITACHGGAWQGIMPEESFFGGGMSVPSLREAVESAEESEGKKLDIMAFDACLMGSAETAYEMKNTARLMVASEQVEAFKSWPYTEILRRAFEEKGTVTPEELGAIIVEESAKVRQDMLTMGLIDLSRMEEVRNAAGGLAEKILANAMDLKELKTISARSQKFFMPVSDMYHFADQIVKSTRIRDTKLVDAARNMLGALQSAVLKEEHSTETPSHELITDSDILAMSNDDIKKLYELKNAHGLNVELTPYYSSYNNLEFAKETKWAQAMKRIGQA